MAIKPFFYIKDSADHGGFSCIVKILDFMPYLRIFYSIILFYSGFSLLPFTSAHACNVNNHDNFIGVMLTNDKGEILYKKNIDREFIPASTLKILTSLEAIHFLGKNFHFHTDFFIDKQYNLKIKGYGDPLLTSESIKILCKRLSLLLKQKNINNINSIVIDNSFFAPNINIPGTGKSYNPYDSPVGALCANFNTVFFTYDKSKKKFISAESQTPLLSFAEKRIKASMLKKGRIVLSPSESRIYAGLLIKYFLKLQGIHIICHNDSISPRRIGNGCDIELGHINTDDEKILTWVSPYRLEEIIQRLLRYSNNFIANQIFLHIGAKVLSPPATTVKGVQVLKNYAENILELNDHESNLVFGPDPLATIYKKSSLVSYVFHIKKIKINEGSGLSRDNRITPGEMIKILFAFMPYHDLMRVKFDVMRIKSRGGKEKRVKIEEFYKTGTLKYVRTRAGYFKVNNKRIYPYVIMVNQKKCRYHSHEADLVRLRRLQRIEDSDNNRHSCTSRDLPEFHINTIRKKLEEILINNPQ